MARKYKDVFEWGRKPLDGRIEYEQRPHTGEFWALCDCRGVVEVTTVDPCGRWFSYDRVEIADGKIRNGSFGVTDIDDGAYKVEFPEEIHCASCEQPMVRGKFARHKVWYVCVNMHCEKNKKKPRSW